MNKIMYFIITTCVAIVLIGATVWYHKPIKQIASTSFITKQTIQRPTIGNYTTQTFNLGSVQNISNKQLQQHQQLYAGYVKKRNEIAQKLQTVDRKNSANRTYSPFRSLKLAETYAVNGSILHELYFQNLSQPGGQPGPLTTQLLEKNFGSLEKFKQDFMDCGGCSRGWVVTSYSIDDGLVHNYVFEEHNQHVPVLTLPLLVLDVYEHAYMIDFGINREPYLQAFWNNIDWNVVEQRVTKWVQPHN